MSDFWFGAFIALAAWSTLDFVACLRYRGATMKIDEGEIRRTRAKAVVFVGLAFFVGVAL